MRKRWFIGILLVAAVILSACGANMSGEPEIRDEFQIRPSSTPLASPTPDTPAEPTAEAVPADESAAADAAPQGDATPEPDRTLGRELFLVQCVQCHGGEDGVGPSLFATIAEADTRVEGLSAAEYIYQSIIDPGAYVLEGYENIMPSYEGQFSDFELESIVAFIAEAQGRPTADSLSGATPTPIALAPEGDLSVQGHVVQGTEGGETIPAGLDLELLALNSDGNLVGQYDTVTTEEGAYKFEGIARAPGNMYLIRANYAGVPQGVQISAIQGSETALSQDVTVYERTSERDSVQVSWAQMLLNFAPINEFGLEVWLTVELVNNGDRIVTTDEVADNGWLIAVPLELPPGSFGIQAMQTEGSSRFQVVLVDGVPVVNDTWPLRPGQTQTITVAYYLPYTDQAVIDTAFGYPVVDGAVYIPNDTVEFQSEQFDEEQEFRYRVAEGGFHITELMPGDEIDPETDFTLVSAHELKAAVGADDHLSFTLVGRPTRTIDVISASPEAATSNGGDGETDLLPIAIFVLGVSILALAGVLWWRERAAKAMPVAARATADVDDWDPPTTADGKPALLAAIVDLEDAHAAGKLDDETFEERRALLTARLMPLLGDDEDEA